MRAVRTIAAVALAAGTLAACELPTPRMPFTVTSTASTPDHTPGDGVCEATPGVGDCTLPAAVTEANAVARAAVSVPAGTYQGMELVITGDVDLNWDAPVGVTMVDSSLTVASGGSARVEGLSTAEHAEQQSRVELVAAGTLALRRSSVAVVDEQLGGVALTVQAGGSAVVQTSELLGGLHGISNAGTVVVSASTLRNLFSGRIDTAAGGASYLQGSVLSRAVNTGAITSGCTGTSPTSLGYNHFAPFAFGCTTHPDDVFADELIAPHPVNPDSPDFVGIDAIAVGEAGCELGGVDLRGNPRPVDGDGDGEAACDVGAIEYQP